VKERPILFSGPMVRALLAGTKVQTRRVVKPQPIMRDGGDCVVEYGKQRHSGPAEYLLGHVLPKFGCPYGQPGDRLWVREAHMIQAHPADIGLSRADIPKTWDAAVASAGSVIYRADPGAELLADGRKWSPSIHMPRWASRLTLEITGVRVERLNDISESDALAEGVTAVSSGGVTLFTTTGVNCFQTAKDAYAALWESINGPGSWDANPWVWVVEFKRANGGEG